MLLKHIKRAKIFLNLTMWSMVISSWSLSFIPLAEKMNESEAKVVSIIVATVFWSGLLIGFIAMLFATYCLKTSYKKMVNKNYMSKQWLPGAFSFSKKWRLDFSLSLP